MARPAAQRYVPVMGFRDLRRHLRGRMGRREMSCLRAEARDQETGHDAFEPCPGFLGLVSYGRPAFRVLPTAPAHQACNSRLSLGHQLCPTVTRTVILIIMSSSRPVSITIPSIITA